MVDQKLVDFLVAVFPDIVRVISGEKAFCEYTEGNNCFELKKTGNGDLRVYFSFRDYGSAHYVPVPDWFDSNQGDSFLVASVLLSQFIWRCNYKNDLDAKETYGAFMQRVSKLRAPSADDFCLTASE